MVKRISKDSSKQKKSNKEANGKPRSFIGFFKSEITHFITGLVVLMLTVYCALAMVSFFFSGAADQSKVEGLSVFHPGNVAGIENWTGTRGACISNLLMNEWFGVSTFFMLFFLASVGLKLMRVKKIKLFKRFIFTSLATIWTSVAASFFFGTFFRETAIFIGGNHGFIISDILIDNIGIPGAFMLIITVLVVIMIFVSAQTIPFLRKLFNITHTPKQKGTQPDVDTKNTNTADKGEEEKEGEEGPEIPIEFTNPQPHILTIDEEKEERPFVEKANDTDFEVIKPDEEEYIGSDEKTVSNVIIPNEGEEVVTETEEQLEPYDPKADLSNYRNPTMDLLVKYDTGSNQVDMGEQNENKNRIIRALENFGIKIKSIKATVGPTITLYEIVPEDGIRISKIRNLADDIAMNLSALGIRIIAPIPGKGTIGIEVPNKDPQIVSMQSVIASKKFQETKFDLPIALGKTISNDVFMVDLCKMPHLLVAGATGQGKSVGLNAIITSLLYKKHPAELKFVLVDPKRVEFNIYSTIEKHFLAKLPDEDAAIITDVTKVVHTLNSIVKEMETRYSLLEKAGVRNIKEYNEMFIGRRLNPLKGHLFMPYIVVIIDEFGDLIMTAGKEIELPIARIAQMARAVGIHMIIATQRPSVTIITGAIKANFPARIAFRVATAIDSRTILDGSGANQLIGKGDFLFSQGSDMTRVQCAFVDTEEVRQISKYIEHQQGYPMAFLLPEYTGDEGGDKVGTVDLADKDSLFEEAARLVVIHQQGSTSLIQRKFSIGYNRAGRIMDQLEAAGIVGAFEGSKARQVLVADEYHLDQLLNNL